MIWPSPPVRSAEEIHGFSIPALHSVSRIPAGASAAATVGAGGPRTGPAGGDGGAKPGTVTGVQVLLWTFLALDALGEAFSIIDLIGHCHPIGLVALTYTLHVTVQSLLTPVHLARGKRRAWIWSLVSAVVGVRFSAAGVAFGIVCIDAAVPPLVIGLVFAALNGTLLGLPCSGSVRQWILMHRVQRGEMQAVGGVSGVMGAPPERPVDRPGAATLIVVLLGTLVARCVWTVYSVVDTASTDSELLGWSFFGVISMRHDIPLPGCRSR